MLVPADAASQLASLECGVDLAMQRRDFWYLVTSAGLTPHSYVEAMQTVEYLATELGVVLSGSRTLDVGCGTGRHAVALASSGATVVGIDSCEPLVDLARTLAPEASFDVVDILDAPALGSFDLVVAFAHSLFSDGLRADHIARLRAVRSCLFTGGTAVLELLLPDQDNTVTVWRSDPKFRVTEEARTSRDGGTWHVRRKFEFQTLAASWTAGASSTHYDEHELQELADTAGFNIESMQIVNNETCFAVLRAEGDFNYLSDLAEFLDAWASPEHRRNKQPAGLIADADGRTRPDQLVALGSGAALTRHHPQFLDAIEPAIRPLVQELVEKWGQISYSSCGGHRICEDGQDVFTEAYCGLVALSSVRAQQLETLLHSVQQQPGTPTIVTYVRHRSLLGPVGSVEAVDLCFGRAHANISWSRYEAALREVIARAVSGLSELRQGSPNDLDESAS